MNSSFNLRNYILERHIVVKLLNIVPTHIIVGYSWKILTFYRPYKIETSTSPTYEANIMKKIITNS